MSDQPVWRNRIVGEGEKPASQFLANPSNWRVHTPEQAAAIDSILDHVGWVQRVIENVTTGHVLDGHLRIERALKRGDATPIPYVLVSLTEDEERMVLATYDPLAALADAHRAQLGHLLEGLTAPDAALGNLLKDLALTAADPTAETVSFTVEDRPACPTCGRKLRKGQTLSQ